MTRSPPISRRAMCWSRQPGPRVRGNALFFGTYAGGHMFYLRKESRAEFAKDVKGFFEASP